MGVLEYGIRGDVAELYKKRPKEDTRVKAGGQKEIGGRSRREVSMIYRDQAYNLMYAARDGVVSRPCESGLSMPHTQT
jgi:hypothetical protein